MTMANDESGSAEAGERRRRVPPPTIDLAATDVSAQAAANASAETMASAHPDQTTSNAPPAGDAKRRSASRWSLVAAGVLGAALALVVAAGAWVLAGGVPDTGGDRGGDTNARLTRIETQLGTLARNGASTGDAKPLDDLAQRLGRIESTLAQQSAVVDRQVKPLTDRLADLDRRDQEVMAAAQVARERADTAAKSLADVAQQLATLNAERARTPQVERGDVDALAARLASLESATKAIGEQLARIAGGTAAASSNARQTVSAIALYTAVERGLPYVGELDAIRSFADPATVSALEPFAKSGVPSAARLAHEASALVPALVTAADTAQPNGTFARLWLNAKRMIRLRPVGDVPGDDPAAVIARLELKAAGNDLDGVLAEANNLPAAARGPIEPWVKRAQARIAALAAADRLAADALKGASLGASER